MCGFRPGNALALVEGYDVVVDASDNPATRYLVRWVMKIAHFVASGALHTAIYNVCLMGSSCSDASMLVVSGAKLCGDFGFYVCTFLCWLSSLQRRLRGGGQAAGVCGGGGHRRTAHRVQLRTRR